MTSKLGGLVADVAETHKVTLIDPVSDLPITDKQGQPSYVEVLSVDSAVGREFDKLRRSQATQRALRGRNQLLAADDQLEENWAKLARLTRGWYLVDPATQEPIDLPFSEAAALEVYSGAGTAWLYRQVWLAAADTANFIRRSSRSSSPSPSTSSAAPDGSQTGQA